MNRAYNYIKFLIVSVVLVFVMRGRVLADGDVRLSVDKDSCAVSDEIKVSVNADNPSDASVAPEISITYDTGRLSFKDCSCAYGGGGGGLISLNETNADIFFTVLSGGTAVVEASAVFDGDGASAKSASVTISVDGEDTAAQSEVVEASDLSIEGGSIAGADGNKLVSSVFADEFMPMGFYKTTITYEEQLVEAAQFDMGDIVLLYVTDENGNNGNFNVYNRNTGELTDFLQISGIENKFIIILRSEDTESEPPEGFSLATLQWNDQTLDAYSNDKVDDFVLLYAISSEGNKGWYLYDQKEGTYQRFVDELYSASGVKSNPFSANADNADTDDEDTEKTEKKESLLDKKVGGIDLKVIIIAGIGIIAILLLIVVIIIGARFGDDREDEYLTEGTDSTGNAENIKGTDSIRADNIKTPEKIKNNDNIKNPLKQPSEPKLTASELVAREMNSGDNIYEKYRQSDEQNKAAANVKQPDENSGLIDEEFLSKDEKKALKAEKKARKKAEKLMKKEFGEFGPANFSEWQQVVRDDRKVSAEELMDAQAVPSGMQVNISPTDMNAGANANINANAGINADANTNAGTGLNAQTTSEDNLPLPEDVDVSSMNIPSYVKPKDQAKASVTEENNDQALTGKDSYVDMMKKLPANDKNEPVQPKPVQQFDLDDDFEFEYLNLDDE